MKNKIDSSLVTFTSLVFLFLINKGDITTLYHCLIRKIMKAKMRIKS